MAGPEGEHDGAMAGMDSLSDDAEPPMVIGLTDEETRAGEVALFGTWNVLHPGAFRIGPQLGLGLDPDKPQAFLGIAVGLGPYVKLSGGWTWQEVRTLARGQEVGETEVAEDEDISLRRTFDDDWYAALTISIDNLPFFGGGGDGE